MNKTNEILKAEPATKATASASYKRIHGSTPGSRAKTQLIPGLHVDVKRS